LTMTLKSAPKDHMSAAGWMLVALPSLISGAVNSVGAAVAEAKLVLKLESRATKPRASVGDPLRSTLLGSSAPCTMPQQCRYSKPCAISRAVRNSPL